MARSGARRHPDPALAAGPGVDFLRAMLAGDTPAPPLSRLTGMRPVQFSPGCAAVRDAGLPMAVRR